MNEMPAAPPVDVAGDALAQQFAPSRSRERTEVDVGEMGEGEHYYLVKPGLGPGIHDF
jgi:hypothetical protein